MDLSTVERVQALLQSGGASTDGLTDLISMILADVSGRVEEHLGRGAKVEPRVETFDTDSPMRGVLLEAFPVAADPAPVVVYDPERKFDGDPLDASLWVMDYARGIVRFDRWWPAIRPRCLRVSYTGGMATDTTAFTCDHPTIAHAVDLQCAHLVQRRRALGATGESVGGGSVSAVGAYDLLPEVSNIINLFRRRMV